MLKYENVSISCDHTLLLENISFSIEDGSLTTIIGPNGCGKTSLLQALNGNNKVTGGGIFLDNCDILALNPRKRATLISYLPQIRGTIPTLPVKTLTEHGRFPHLGFARKMNNHDKDIVLTSMELAGVSRYANQTVDTLSGGIRQRAYIAMQLAQDCRYIIADEPTTYLDIPSQNEIISIYQKQKEAGKTVVLVLHDISKALSISDKIIVMNDKKIAAIGTPSELLKQHIIEEVFNVNIKAFTDKDSVYYVFE